VDDAALPVLAGGGPPPPPPPHLPPRNLAPLPLPLPRVAGHPHGPAAGPRRRPRQQGVQRMHPLRLGTPAQLRSRKGTGMGCGLRIPAPKWAREAALTTSTTDRPQWLRSVTLAPASIKARAALSEPWPDAKCSAVSPYVLSSTSIEWPREIRKSIARRHCGICTVGSQVGAGGCGTGTTRSSASTPAASSLTTSSARSCSAALYRGVHRSIKRCGLSMAGARRPCDCVRLCYDSPRPRRPCAPEGASMGTSQHPQCPPRGAHMPTAWFRLSPPPPTFLRPPPLSTLPAEKWRPAQPCRV
jgi:hypothetical protein